ncbi:hypothetical protein [Sphingomonas changbaiensis]|uniref:hypothetical protein n=1 Tax=Sphingomonas changbaiensis TaxID=529705 RepID=UPI000AADAB87|nr:hypothetical protein [Sphingomonas changbaiensis]
MTVETIRLASGIIAAISGVMLVRDLRRGRANWGGFFGDRLSRPGPYWLAVTMTGVVFVVTLYRAMIGFPE